MEIINSDEDSVSEYLNVCNQTGNNNVYFHELLGNLYREHKYGTILQGAESLIRVANVRLIELLLLCVRNIFVIHKFHFINLASRYYNELSALPIGDNEIVWNHPLQIYKHKLIARYYKIIYLFSSL